MSEKITDTVQLLSKPWQKFLAKFKDIEALPTSEWKEVHLLGYFCQRYERCYQQKFALSFRGAPSKCNEIYMIKKTMVMLNTLSSDVVKLYIDWVFDGKIIPGKIKIRSIGFLTTPGFGNEFNQYRAKKEKIVKSTELPIKYQEIIDGLGLPVYTYGDLAFVLMALDQSSTDQITESHHLMSYKNLFKYLIAVGFEPATLNNL